MKKFIDVTTGDYQAMTPEQRKAYDAEWWRRVTRWAGDEPRGFTGRSGDDNRDNAMQAHEWGE